MYEIQASNKRRSWLLIGGLGGLLLLCGVVFGEAIAPGGGMVGLPVSAAVWGVMTLTAVYAGRKIVLASAGARRIEHGDHPRLFNVVEEMAIAAGMAKPPQVYIIDSPAPNAFATGISEEESAVAVTSGLIEKLDRDELQGVVAHEMGHIRNRDILFMTLAVVFVGAIVFLSEVMWRAIRSGALKGGRGKKGGGGLILVLVLALLLAILAPIVARLLYLAISRRREYLADATAAELTRYPEGLARALEKIADDHHALAGVSANVAPMYIINPLAKWTEIGAGLFSTHPPTAERIAILRAMGSGASAAEYDASFRAFHGGKLASPVPTSVVRAAQPLPLRAAPAPGATAPSVAAPESRQERRREALDAVRLAAGFRIFPCTCGVKVKVPPTYKQPAVRCPRCKASLGVRDR